MPVQEPVVADLEALWGNRKPVRLLVVDVSFERPETRERLCRPLDLALGQCKLGKETYKEGGEMRERERVEA